MAKRKPNQRIQNKHKKAAENEKLQAVGYSPKEVKNLSAADREKEIKRIYKNERARTLRNERRTALLNEGVPLSIITRDRLDRKAVDFSNKTQLSDWRRQGEKLDAFRAAGYNGKITTTDLRLGWAKFAAKYSGVTIPEKYHKKLDIEPVNTNDSIRLTGSKYLYVGVSEVKDGFSIANMGSIPTEDLHDLVSDLIAIVKNNEDDSGSFSAVFTWAMGSKKDMEYRAQVYHKRGYNLNSRFTKLSTEQYQKITVSNKWSYREFLELMYACMTHMKNSDVLKFNDFLKNYCIVNKFPFMDDFPFVEGK